MAKRAETAPTPRIPLSRERVLRAAIALADEGGIEALSMRRLGQELGVEAMSLYNHVANKDEILDGITDLVLSDVEHPPSRGDWKQELRRSAISTHELLRRHPWAVNLALSPSRDIPVRVKNMEWTLGRLREAFPAELTYHAYHAVDSHIMGFTLWELGHSLKPEDIGDLAAAFVRDFPANAYPHVHEHVEQHITGFGSDEKGAFEFLLDLILDGLETLRDGA